VRKLLKVAAPLLAVGILAACSSQGASSASASSSNSPVTIDLWNTYVGPLETELTSIVKDFESTHPNIKVKLVYQPYATELQSLQTAVAAHQPPALAQLEMSDVGTLVSDGALSPVSSLLSSSSAQALDKSLIPSVASVNTFQGKLYTVPMGYNSNVLYYNKDLLAKDGINPQDLTWTELEADSEKISKDSNGSVDGYAFPAEASWILEARFWQSGVTLFNTAGTKATFDTPQGVSMFTNYKQLLDTKAAEMVYTDADLDQLTDLFAAGKVAMFEQSSTAVQNIEAETKFPIGVATFPTMGKQAYSMGGYNLGIFSGVPQAQQQAAATFAQWWSSPAIAAQWTSISDYLPGVTAAYNTSTYAKWKAADPSGAAAAQQLPYAQPEPDMAGAAQIETDMQNAFDATMDGKGSAASNLSTLANESNTILAQNSN
jgi:ABC-type glycerol-3-phosphate transport system substrate-binding protein